MGWIISKALYESLPCLQEQAAEYSVESCSGGERFAPSNTTPTPQAYLSPDKMTAFSRLSRFGMTFALLTESPGADWLTLYLADFPARTYPLPEPAQGLTGPDRDCGQKWLGSLAKYDRDTHSLKTAQCSLIEDSTESCVILPRSGLMRNGRCYPLPTVVRRTDGSESGLWPTPQASDNRDRGNLSSPAVVRRAAIGKQLMLSQVVSDQSGTLNPTWVEWLIGFPLGWTDLKPLEMHRFLSWRQQHSES